MEKIMKLSADTVNVLKNFASINSGIEFKKGKTLTTISSNKAVLGKATLQDQIEDDFCIYDLNQFLSVYSINDSTELEFDEQNIIFKSGKSKIKYRKAAKNLIVSAPDKTLAIPSKDAEFTLSEEDYKAIMKSASILESEHIIFESDGGKIYATTCTIGTDGNPTSHSNSIEVGDNNGNTFKAVFLRDNFKMIPGHYDIEISSKGLASFNNTKVDLDYWIAVEVKLSSFGG
jgi:hypothetical protein